METRRLTDASSSASVAAFHFSRSPWGKARQLWAICSAMLFVRWWVGLALAAGTAGAFSFWVWGPMLIVRGRLLLCWDGVRKGRGMKEGEGGRVGWWLVIVGESKGRCASLFSFVLPPATFRIRLARARAAARLDSLRSRVVLTRLMYLFYMSWRPAGFLP